ncbi:TrkA C-terminal domain-containing protein [Peptoniphilus sp. BV3AC2]|uniref:TrkA C-terminal domain-containing protein n=1 Tax=Peptoniphilus sp. BV3AC2 TaxID=1111133 RepID=UPI0003B89695|nr:TrkA C-terminal domain-containing protein [Peptoniphilus sp. BV3AC2]ERT63798.1 Trk system potassium uptake protein TrkA, C-terminal domain protein [Peptoniphilus sp. BV3AC2]
MYEYNVEENGKLKDKLIKDISFPVNLMIVEIDRETEKIVPKGDTKLMSGDKLLVIAPKGDFYKVDEYFKD